MTLAGDATVPQGSPVNLGAIEECPLCGGREHRVLLEESNVLRGAAFEPWTYLNARPVPLKQCRRCTFAFTGELPPRTFFEQVIYNPSEVPAPVIPTDQPGGKEYVFDHVLALLEKHGAKGPLLDVGAGNGRFMYRARRLFDRMTGIEMSHRDGEMARSHGLDVREADVQSLLAELGDTFGTVTLIDVLEHLPNPLRQLELLKRALRPGGHLYIKVPHLYGQLVKERLRATLPGHESLLMTNFAHINHFSESSLVRALERVGFEVVHANASPSDFNTVPKGSSNPVRYASMGLRIGFFRLTEALHAFTHVNAGFHLDVLARLPG